MAAFNSYKIMSIELRWYLAPCNIYSDKKNLKSDYNYGFEILKIYNICPKNKFMKID